QQISTLFWINVLVGLLLTLLSAGMAPVIAVFYHEPRLFAVTIALAFGFLFNAVGVQHGALLQREMRFTALAVINTISMMIGAVIGIGGAKAGYGYWALVAMTVSAPIVGTVGFWLATGWVPGLPHRRVGIRSMMRFGGTITLNGLIVYIASNLEKVLIGRFWGADAIGIYGRAYQLINIPTDNLNAAAGEVAFSALSRLQDDPRRLKSYFLKGYSLVLALTVPITIACALFADDMILVLLGPKWKEAAAVFRLLAPTVLIFAIANPLSWLLTSIGWVGRNLKLSLFIAPTMIAGYVIGLPYGPKGVALGYSAVLTLWLLPLIAYCVRGTVVSVRDILHTASRPFASSIIAAGLAYCAALLLGTRFSPLPRLVMECTVLLVTYLAMLLFGMNQKDFYVDLLRGMRKPASIDGNALISA
ncbi:MAG TPA: lipopolysaccharide biosynthesis protein, partial [Terriglobales bacterium]|nr:lipopolysaccharide biosynthesis protein [Terriglobales bacterium]